MAKITKKKKHPVRNIISIALIFVSCIFIWLSVEEVITTVRLKREISDKESLIGTLKKEEKDLRKKKENLEDPEYVKRYARGEYLVSKPGEQIFKLPAKGNMNEDDK